MIESETSSFPRKRVSRETRTPGFPLRENHSLKLLFGLILALLPSLLLAAQKLEVVYLELEHDPRYLDATLFWQTPAQPWGRPFDGARVALREGRFPLKAVGIDLELQRESVADANEAVATINARHEQGVRFFLVDLPGPVQAEIASATRDLPVMLFNVSAEDDDLRQAQCQPHLLHTMPSRTMQTDALMQYLVSRKWREILVLRGPEPADAAYFQAVTRSAKRFGVKIDSVKDFVLGADPRERGRNNVALLTSRADYDAVLVADARGEFARDVPYQTQDPRPVVGAAGLVPVGWHWAYDRQGAPQLNKRFMKKARRHMTTHDWSAWIAVKAITEALVRTGSTETDVLSKYIRSEDIVLDGFKGYRLSFRHWNNQMRQPIFLTQANWVTARAPLDGFLHQKNNLDTLGFDERETKCTF